MGPDAQSDRARQLPPGSRLGVWSAFPGRLWPIGHRPPQLPALYAADSAAYAPIQGEPNSVRLPLFHQLDLRIDKRWQFAYWRLSTYLDVQNAYNHMAVEGYSYNYNYSQRVRNTGVPILPSLGVRGEF